MFRKKNQPEEKKSAPVEKIANVGAEQGSASRPAPAVASSGASQVAGGPAAQRQRVAIDESELVTCYANFCRVTGTPEEVLLDLGLNPQAIGATVGNVKVNQRVVFNYYTAKRMLAALQVTVARHEQAFGAIEIDVQKRAKTPAETQ